MNLKTIITLSIIILLLAAACTEPEPTPTSAPSPTAVPPTSTATHTAVPTEEPTATAVPPTPTPEPTAKPITDNGLPITDNDEGGPVAITGLVTYTNPFFTLGVAAPVVILEDQAGFVDRDKNYIFPVESQTLGQITSDFYTSPFSYSIALPIEPQGAWRDVDFDDEEEQGVQVFAIAYWTNTFGDPFLEERDLGGGGWSTAYASTKISRNPEHDREISGGKLLVYAPDDQQGFPQNFGPDGLLFTGDEEMINLPAGYTLVDLDTAPFTFDRSRRPRVDLVEPDGAALVDYSELGYTEAFNALVDQLINEYAFTEYKNIDWEALRAEFEPRFMTAEATGDDLAYRRALRDFAWRIPDGHVSGPFVQEDFRDAVLGGIGLAIKELDDGTAVVTFLTPNGPAAQAGIEWGAEIIAINEVAISEHIDQTVSYFGPYSTAHAERQDKLLFATRFPRNAFVTVTYQDPGGAVQTAELNANSELESYFYWVDNKVGDGLQLPVEYELLDEGIGYVAIYSFSDNDVLTVQLWERMIRDFKEAEVSAIIVDMRRNGGGRGFLADQMAAYFFDEPLELGNTAAYDRDRGEFHMDEEPQRFILPPDESLRYDGPVVVLVAADCASACEFFSYDMTLQNRATIIGHTPTAGLGGPVDEVAMPEDEAFRFTQGRAVDMEGNIHIEGIGVVPDIVVPVDETAVLGEEDALLQAAIRYLSGESVDGGTLVLGDEASGTLTPKSRVQYTVTLSAGDVVNLLLESNSAGQNVIMRILDPDSGQQIVETDPDIITGFVGIELDEDLTLLIEVRAEDDTAVVEYTLSIEDGG
ncbi:MAG TPA: S41 family peptidase [Chloroflexota bacterium]|nr:S41 family peptidase [Chloroflexota bacterium]